MAPKPGRIDHRQRVDTVYVRRSDSGHNNRNGARRSGEESSRWGGVGFKIVLRLTQRVTGGFTRQRNNEDHSLCGTDSPHATRMACRQTVRGA